MASVLALPDDLLVNIAEKVALFEDFVALRGVCKSWRSAAAKGNFSNRPQIPWLMLVAKEGSDVREFYSLSKDMILRETLPEANEKRCRCLASEGWLITIGKDLNMSLLHPISGVEIHLVDPVDEENSDFEENSELTYGTTGFQVFEVEISNGGWKEVKTLGGRALFLGHNSSFSFEAHGCIKADCIYFTDDDLEAYVGEDNLAGGGKDMGIYNMEDRSITPHFDGCCKKNVPKEDPADFNVIPCICDNVGDRVRSSGQNED
ncbi:hypothetical protein RJ640_013859 [Escallonia rubra]|uniref:F-box domain-containing protein n=1 Tax=Escallonia rubra TaxID=112253 RepID=A0AA88SGF4_9ASTE|nr:hypothetical protein RJ640_013859 [Escallonia rubra]